MFCMVVYIVSGGVRSSCLGFKPPSHIQNEIRSWLEKGQLLTSLLKQRLHGLEFTHNIPRLYIEVRYLVVPFPFMSPHPVSNKQLIHFLDFHFLATSDLELKSPCISLYNCLTDVPADVPTNHS